jgi:hypothetical protein
MRLRARFAGFVEAADLGGFAALNFGLTRWS